jgi:hypothetical protein
MALELTNLTVAHEIADRIRTLIARRDDGDVTAAARRLDRPIADLYLPERVIASGNDAALDFLASIVRNYDADACWLITGTTAGDALPLSSGARGTIVELLGEVSDRLIEQVRSERVRASSWRTPPRPAS